MNLKKIIQLVKFLDLPIKIIRFENVSFGYKTKASNDFIGSESSKIISGDEEIKIVDVFNDVSFEIRGGSTVALVGPTSSYKKSFLLLIPAAYIMVK